MLHFRWVWHRCTCNNAIDAWITILIAHPTQQVSQIEPCGLRINISKQSRYILDSACTNQPFVCIYIRPFIHSSIYLSIYLFHWNSLVQIMSMFPLRDAIISLNVHIFVHLGRRHCSSIELPVTLFAGASGVHFHARLCRRHDSRSAVDGICVS